MHIFKPKSEFTRNVLTLMTGTTIAQAIPIAISPILTRIYTPEDFGIFALYISIASILSLIATGRYELAIMLPTKDKDAVNIVALSLFISFFVSFIALLIVSIFNTQITSLLGNPDISSWLYFIPLTVLFTGIYQSFNYWSNRKKEYKRLATSKVIQSTTTATTNLSMGFAGFGSSGLVLASVLGQGVVASFLAQRVYKEGLYRLKDIETIKILVMLKKYKKLPLFNLPNALIDGIRVSGISILIAKNFTTASLGQFSLAWKIVQTPTALIGSSLSQVFFQKIATAKRADLYLIVTKFLLKSTLISLPIFLFIYICAEDIFAIVFGQEWRLAGEIASLLSPWIFFNFLTAPMGNLFIVLNRQEIVLVVSLFYMLVPLMILLTLHQFGFIYVLGLISFAMSIILLLYIGLVLIYTHKEQSNGL